MKVGGDPAAITSAADHLDHSSSAIERARAHVSPRYQLFASSSPELSAGEHLAHADIAIGGVLAALRQVLTDDSEGLRSVAQQLRELDRAPLLRPVPWYPVVPRERARPPRDRFIPGPVLERLPRPPVRRADPIMPLPGRSPIYRREPALHRPPASSRYRIVAPGGPDAGGPRVPITRPVEPSPRIDPMPEPPRVTLDRGVSGGATRVPPRGITDLPATEVTS